MVKTFYVQRLKASEVLKRIHALGIFDHNLNWGVDLDEKLNAITFRISYTAGAAASEKEAEAMGTIESFINAIDMSKPPK
jgi:hypothetical protein